MFRKSLSKSDRQNGSRRHFRSNGVKYWDFSSQSSLLNFCLHVEGGKLWVPRDVLACHSETLKNLIYGPLKEKKEKDSEKADLPGKPYKDVLEWMRCIVPCPKQKPVDGKCKFDRFLKNPWRGFMIHMGRHVCFIFFLLCSSGQLSAERIELKFSLKIISTYVVPV